jgi:hypothetical protein
MTMDINKIFNLFDEPKDESKTLSEEEYSKTVEIYKNHPLYFVGMFKKLIHNHYLFNKQLLKFFEKLDEPLDPIDVSKAGEYVVFSKAWEYIKKIDPDDLKHQEALYHFLDDYLKVALELALNYFQEQEEYEKCVHLKKNLDFVKLLLT